MKVIKKSESAATKRNEKGKAKFYGGDARSKVTHNEHRVTRNPFLENNEDSESDEAEDSDAKHACHSLQSARHLKF